MAVIPNFYHYTNPFLENLKDYKATKLFILLQSLSLLPDPIQPAIYLLMPSVGHKGPALRPRCIRPKKGLNPYIILCPVFDKSFPFSKER